MRGVKNKYHIKGADEFCLPSIWHNVRLQANELFDFHLINHLTLKALKQNGFECFISDFKSKYKSRLYSEHMVPYSYYEAFRNKQPLLVWNKPLNWVKHYTKCESRWLICVARIFKVCSAIIIFIRKPKHFPGGDTPRLSFLCYFPRSATRCTDSGCKRNLRIPMPKTIKNCVTGNVLNCRPWYGIMCEDL